MARSNAGQGGAGRGENGGGVATGTGQQIDQPAQLAHRIQPGGIGAHDVREMRRIAQAAVPRSQHHRPTEFMQAGRGHRRYRRHRMDNVPIGTCRPPPAHFAQCRCVVDVEIRRGNQEHRVLALPEQPRRQPVQRAGEPFGVDINHLRSRQGCASRFQRCTVADMGQQGHRQALGQP